MTRHDTKTMQSFAIKPIASAVFLALRVGGERRFLLAHSFTLHQNRIAFMPFFVLGSCLLLWVGCVAAINFWW